jgi:glyoxylase-like metal-dependent hydrolase (beta-lactamase superfamily II)
VAVRSESYGIACDTLGHGRLHYVGRLALRSLACDGASMKPLTWDVFVTPGIPVVTNDLPPGAKQRLWSPMSATVISGERDAVLVDTFMTVDQATALADWVAAIGKTLTTIYATHGHGDHFFGAGTILKRFPGARLLQRRMSLR